MTTQCSYRFLIRGSTSPIVGLGADPAEAATHVLTLVEGFRGLAKNTKRAPNTYRARRGGPAVTLVG